MKNFTPIILEKYNDNKNYNVVDKNIYLNIRKQRYCVAVLIELEKEETLSYPFEDMLDAYRLNHVTIINEYIENDSKFVVFEVEDCENIGLQSINLLKKFLNLEGKDIRLERINNQFKLCVS